MVRTSLFALSCCLVVGCSDSNEIQTPNSVEAGDATIEESVEVAIEASETPAEQDMQLTAYGYGDLTIGMSRDDILNLLGGPAVPETVAGMEPEACEVFHPDEAPEGLYVLLENQKLASIYLTEPSQVETAQGLQVGDTAVDVRAAYADEIIETPSKYQEAPAADYTVWSEGATDAAWNDNPAARGIRYSVGTDEKITQINAGGPAIQLVEGCS